MTDIRIAIDTELGRRAIEAAERYLAEYARESFGKERDWPVRHAQFAGLRRIAENEPSKVGEFAEHQGAKAKARLRDPQEMTATTVFWDLVKGYCDGKPPNRFPWSLTQLRKQELPAELHDEPFPPGMQPSKEQRAAREEKKRRREHWEQEWDRDHYSAFFQRFCAHCLYEMSKRTREG